MISLTMRREYCTWNIAPRHSDSLIPCRYSFYSFATALQGAAVVRRRKERAQAHADAHSCRRRRAPRHGGVTTRTRSDFASPSMARHPAPTTASMSMRTDGGGFPTSGFTNWCGRQGRSASTRLKSSSSAQASAPMVLGSDRYRPVSAADAAGALASGRVRGVNAARDGWDHGSQRGQDEIKRCFMAAPSANGLALCNCVYGSRLGRSVLQISCGIMFVEWFIGTGPGILATARSDCGLAGGCGANQALANLCGVRGPWTGWQRCA